MIVIGTPHFGAVAPEWIDAYEMLTKPTRPDGSPDWVGVSVRRLVVHYARNQLVSTTLERYPEATHLFFLDDDVIPPPDALTRLLAHNVPVVTGLYVERAPPHFPVAYRRGQDHHVPLTSFCAGLQEVDACGAGCLLVRTDVLRAIKPPWFDFVGGVSEDLYFCQKAAAAGYRLLLDFDVQCGHLTTQVATYQHFDRLSRAGGVTFATTEIEALTRDVRPWRPGTADHPVTPGPPVAEHARPRSLAVTHRSKP